MVSLENKNILNTPQTNTSTVNNDVVTTGSLTVSGTSILDTTNINDTFTVAGTTTLNNTLATTSQVDLATSSGITTIGSTTAVAISADGLLDINNTLDSTSSTDGCAVFAGGVGIEKQLFVNEVVINTIAGLNTPNINIGTSTTGNSQTPNVANSNVFIGGNAGTAITSATDCIAIGKDALEANQTGNFNIAFGLNALNGSTGASGLAIGVNALNTTTGNDNMGLGTNAGNAITTGINNISIGVNSDVSPTLNNQIALGHTSICDLANQTTIGNSTMAIIRPGANNVCDLGESDRGFKDLYLTGNISVGANQVVSAQGSAVSDAAVTTTVGSNTGTAGAGLSLIGDTTSVDQASNIMNDFVALQEDILDIKTQLNDLLARLRTHGLIAT
jgi:hypothetical protein